VHSCAMSGRRRCKRKNEDSKGDQLSFCAKTVHARKRARESFANQGGKEKGSKGMRIRVAETSGHLATVPGGMGSRREKVRTEFSCRRSLRVSSSLRGGQKEGGGCLGSKKKIGERDRGPCNSRNFKAEPKLDRRGACGTKKST